jgi:hypothetical protein
MKSKLWFLPLACFLFVFLLSQPTQIPNTINGTVDIPNLTFKTQPKKRTMTQRAHRIDSYSAEMFIENLIKDGWLVAHIVPFGPQNSTLLIIAEKKDSEELP